MDFEQVAPRRAEGRDGTMVELLDTHHARLRRPTGEWLVEIKRRDDEDWIGVTVYADSLVRSGGQPSRRDQERALDELVAGLRALRVRVTVDTALGPDDPHLTPGAADADADADVD